MRPCPRLSGVERFTVIEAKRIKSVPGLAGTSGTAGLETALKFRFTENLEPVCVCAG